MTKFRDLPAAQFGRYGETIAARLIRNGGAGVIATFKFSGENDNEAPAIELSDKRIVLPDLDVSMRGRTISIEIKTYGEPKPNRRHGRGALVHGIPARLFDDYVASEAERGIPVHLGVLEVSSGALLVSNDPISKITPRYPCDCYSGCETVRPHECEFRKKWGNSYPQWYFRRDTFTEWHRLEGADLAKLQAEHAKVAPKIRKSEPHHRPKNDLFSAPKAELSPIARHLTGALTVQRANDAAALIEKHGFAGLQHVVEADRSKPGRELADIIQAGYPLDRLGQFLQKLQGADA